MNKKDNKSYTPIVNSIIWDKDISLSAKGMYSMICSTPPGWKSSIKGFASVLKEGVAAVSRAVSELEKAGYIHRCYVRDKNGKYSHTEYRPTLLPFSETPVTENSLSDSTVTENEVDKYICKETNLKETNNKRSDTKENTVCLTGDIKIMEKYLRRPLSPSEYSIWDNWKKDGVRSDIIKRAVEDNEYRKEKMTLHHVDETIRFWDKQGLQTLKDIENYILDAKDINTGRFIRNKFGADDERVEAEYIGSHVNDLKSWRDALLSGYKYDRDQFRSDIMLCPTEVFKYLPNEVLIEAIELSEKDGNTTRKEAAEKAMDKEDIR